MKQSIERQIKTIHAQLKNCRKCTSVCGGPVHGPAIHTKIMLIGQAPGVHEESLGRPFAYTAGKTLFKWLHQATGANESEMREMVYFSAVARCFPGKASGGSGDRVPSAIEIENCRPHLVAEVTTLKPKLILAVGKSAMIEILSSVGFSKTSKLEDFVGQKFKIKFHGQNVTVIPLPHPSGVSRWPQTEPGKTKLAQALELIKKEFSKLSI